MANAAFSALLDWQIGETKTSNINTVECWYQQYLFLQPSSALKQVRFDPNVLFCKMGAGRNKREKLCYQTNDAGLSLRVDVAHQKPLRSHGFPRSCPELPLKVSGGPARALGREQRPKHGQGWAFHCKQVSCFGAEMASTCRRDLVSISLLFIAQLSHHGLYPFMLVLWGSLSALLHFLLTWAMNLSVSPCHHQAVHVSFSSVLTKCRAWLLLERRFASRVSPKHPSEPWTRVGKTDWFISCAQGRDLLEPLAHGPRGQTPSLQLDHLKTGVEESPVWWNSQAPCSAAALWQQGLHIRSHPTCWTLQNLLCSNHSRQQKSLAGPETWSYPAQLVRESAAHPRAGCSHRAEGGW